MPATIARPTATKKPDAARATRIGLDDTLRMPDRSIDRLSIGEIIRTHGDIKQPPGLKSIDGLTVEDGLFAIHPLGSSMSPTFEAGDVLLAVPMAIEPPRISWEGNPVVIAFPKVVKGGCARLAIGRFAMDGKTGSMTVTPDNPGYPPTTFAAGELSWLARVVELRTTRLGPWRKVPAPTGRSTSDKVGARKAARPQRTAR